MVGDIFRCLAPFLLGEYPEATVAMPIVASGEQRWSDEDMLLHILRAAVHWLSQGLPLKCLKIVKSVPEKADRLHSAFRSREFQTHPSISAAQSGMRYDAFISYSRNDREYARVVADTLRESNRAARIFVDELELNPGKSWQQAIYDILDASARIVTLISPDYLQSKVCKEEFNIALFRNRESDANILFPIYLKTTVLPTYMKMVNYADCREADAEKLRRPAPKSGSNKNEASLRRRTKTDFALSLRSVALSDMPATKASNALGGASALAEIEPLRSTA